MPIVLTKKCSWASIVRLGCSLSDHCGPRPNWSEPVDDRQEDRWQFSRAFRLGRRCPVNLASFGDRRARLEGKSVDASAFAWLEAKKAADSAEARAENEMELLRGEEPSFLIEEVDEFLHTLEAYAESEVDHLMWQSATSGARIVCVRKTHRSASRGTTYSWSAEYHEGHKPSSYLRLWDEMDEDPCDEIYPQPNKAEEPSPTVLRRRRRQLAR